MDCFQSGMSKLRLATVRDYTKRHGERFGALRRLCVSWQASRVVYEREFRTMTKAFLAFVVLLLADTAEAALRCGSRLVDNGDREFHVRDRCGEPFWSESWLGVDVVNRGSAFEQQREVQWSVWYYNFGPRALMMRLVFQDGVLHRSDTLGYGVRRIGDSCRANMNFTGLSSGELLARCGEPASRREGRDSLVFRPGPSIENWREQRREEWIYDFGDSRFLRVLRIVNGRVISADPLSR
jgi:hypothetical protein